MRILLVLAVTVLLAGCSSEYVAEYRPPPRADLINVDTWPAVEDATIRPGVNINVMSPDFSGSCTSNFLFRSPDNTTLYLGLAAHCFGPVPTGATVDVGDRRAAGKIVFNGWDHVGEQDRDDYDFGLVQLANSARPLVHPAVLHFGGPTVMADSASVLPGAKVITYGHSVQRPAADPENPREGWVLKNGGGGVATTANQIMVVTDHPGIQGDSGSGLMTAAGGALGVLSLGTTNPAEGQVENRDMPAVNWYVSLDKMMAFTELKDGPEVELVTWPLLAGPELPV